MSEKFSPRDLSAEDAQRLADAEKPFRDRARDPEEVERQRRYIESDRLNELGFDPEFGGPDGERDDSYKTSTEEVVAMMEDRAELQSDDELKKVLKEKSSKS